MKTKDGGTLPLFIGILASTCWIFLILLSSFFFRLQGKTMPFDWWIVILAGFFGAVIIFFAAMGLVRSISRKIEGLRIKKSDPTGK